MGEEDSRYLLAVPVKLRGVAIGVLGFHREQAAGRWRPEEIAAAETVAERLALAVENARLLEEAQRRARRERLAAEITARIRASLGPGYRPQDHRPGTGAGPAGPLGGGGGHRTGRGKNGPLRRWADERPDECILD